MRRYVSLAALALALFICATAADAQDFRGGITGRITDAQGGRLPGVTVTATHLATNVASTATTDSDGGFSIPYLAPGAYKVTAELSGFKKAAREGIEVRIGDRIELALSLEVGNFEETVSVAADTPLLDTRSGSAGQVIDEKRIALMPLSDGNPVRPGAPRTGRRVSRRPEVLASRSTTAARRTSPPTAGPAATSSRSTGLRTWPTAAASPSFRRPAPCRNSRSRRRRSTRSRAHRGRHGERDAQERHQPAPRRRLLPLPRRGPVGERLLPRASRPPQGRHRLQALWLHRRRARGLLAKLYDGRNKTFFFTAFEWLYDTFPEPGQFTVPTAAQRNGDFSALLAQGITIYDPLTAVPPRRRPRRTPAVPRQHHPSRTESARSGATT